MSDLHEFLWLAASESVLFASAAMLAVFALFSLVTAFARSILR